MRNPRNETLEFQLASAASLAPPLQGRGWGGAVPNAALCEAPPTPSPSPEGEGLK